MRVINGVFCAILILFAAVQYNDPDAALWIVIYALAAAWTGVAAFRPGLFRKPAAAGGFVACLVAAAAGSIVLWPTDTGWWRMDVWWESEPAREGMGVMIVVVALLLAAVTAWRIRREQPSEA